TTAGVESWGWGILVLLHRQRGLVVVHVPGGVGPMQAIREELYLDVGIGLEGHGDLACDGLPVSVDGLGDMDTYEPGRRRHIVLPAAPDHGIALAHQKAIARIETVDRTVKIGQHSGVAPIDNIQEQPLVAALERDGLEQADICRTMYQALR